MAATYVLIIGKTSIRIDALDDLVDQYYSEKHTASVTATEYPVESGASLTDHAVRNPYELELFGIVSDQPDAPSSIPREKLAGTAWAEILRALESLELITVITSKGSYNNMLIMTAETTVDRTTGRALLFKINLREILTAESLLGVPSPASGPAVDRFSTTPRGRVITSQLGSVAAAGF